MKNIAIKTIMTPLLVASAVSASICSGYSSNIGAYDLPHRTGYYTFISRGNTYSNGTDYEVGRTIMWNDWEDYDFYKSHLIDCTIRNIQPHNDYDYERNPRSCYELSIHCTVSEKTQFYSEGVTYSQLRGYRYDGTLKWTREKPGSTDISCYAKSGMYVVSRVNNPASCK